MTVHSDKEQRIQRDDPNISTKAAADVISGQACKKAADVITDVAAVSKKDTAVERQTDSQIQVLHQSDMEERVTALLDAFICGFQRTTTLFFGRIVSNPTDMPHFNDWLGYSMTYNRVPFGNGNALHTHNSVEIFVALDGDFEIGYASGPCKDDFADSEHADVSDHVPKEESDAGQEGFRQDTASLQSLHSSCHGAVLQPFDMVACPAGVYHYYMNVDKSQEDRQILTILPGRPAVHWAPQVVGNARSKGANCDNKGALITKDKPYHAPDLPERVFAENEMDPYVRKFGSYTDKRVTTPEGCDSDDPVDYVVHLADPEDLNNKWIKVGYLELRAGKPDIFVANSSAAPGWDLLVIVLRGRAAVRGVSEKVTCFSESLGKLEMMKLPSNGEKFEFSCKSCKSGSMNGGDSADEMATTLLVVKSS
eukprot:CAMPEP_0172659272 /NCGR_PEP_ID=MMETSP1074-20121228/3324_1 /TAXON_ID=2916 /ORGANISM="Ceratium fusus, Strain PA161109" /LENGTH=422 /DNA_ID=CAMNT_0013474715 /DNA_START=34 /DNA_END=1299 /DNA_ORIENTATION=+